jgi:hypothetical protein
LPETFPKGHFDVKTHVVFCAVSMRAELQDFGTKAQNEHTPVQGTNVRVIAVVKKK